MSAISRPSASPPAIEARKIRSVSHIPSSRKGKVRYWRNASMSPELALGRPLASSALAADLDRDRQRRIDPVLLHQRLLGAVGLQLGDRVLDRGDELLVALLHRHPDLDVAAEVVRALELVGVAPHHLVDQISWICPAWRVGTSVPKSRPTSSYLSPRHFMAASIMSGSCPMILLGLFGSRYMIGGRVGSSPTLSVLPARSPPSPPPVPPEPPPPSTSSSGLHSSREAVHCSGGRSQAPVLVRWRSRCRPRPAWLTSWPFRATTSPRERVSTGIPRSSKPLNGS